MAAEPGVEEGWKYALPEDRAYGVCAGESV